jgi:very-short-patch-repair endonuclease
MHQLPHPLPLVFLAAVVCLVAIAATLASGKRVGGKLSQPQARRLLTEREQAMYYRIVRVWPDGYVLAQVAMSALLSARDLGTRNTFDRKVCDFVLVDKAFQVVTVIELDDGSHADKTSADVARDALLQKAGYRTLRYQNVPDEAQLRRDLSNAASKL